MRGIKMRDEAQSIQPGEFRDVDAPGGNLKDAFMTLPFKEPSHRLYYNLWVSWYQAGQRFASIADLQVGDGEPTSSSGHDSSYVGKRIESNVCDPQKNVCCNEKRIYNS